MLTDRYAVVQLREVYWANQRSPNISERSKLLLLLKQFNGYVAYYTAQVIHVLETHVRMVVHVLQTQVKF